MRRRQGQAAAAHWFHGRYGRTPPTARPRHRLDGHRRVPHPHRQPRARARADPRQPDRRRLRRHTAFGIVLGDDLDKRRDELRATLPIRRVVGPADVAALAVHIMSNTALTGATYDIDGGQQLVS